MMITRDNIGDESTNERYISSAAPRMPRRGMRHRRHYMVEKTRVTARSRQGSRVAVEMRQSIFQKRRAIKYAPAGRRQMAVRC